MRTLVIALAIVATSIELAQAASPCKGLDQPKCTTLEVIPGNKACLWVQGYKTVAGTDRKSYCRASNKRAQ